MGERVFHRITEWVRLEGTTVGSSGPRATAQDGAQMVLGDSTASLLSVQILGTAQESSSCCAGGIPGIPARSSGATAGLWSRAWPCWVLQPGTDKDQVPSHPSLSRLSRSCSLSLSLAGRCSRPLICVSRS